MNGNYTRDKPSCAVKLRAAVLGVTAIACTRNSHFNIPTWTYPAEYVSWVCDIVAPP